MRLSRGGEFRAVYDAATRVSVGPLLVYALPNDRDNARIGLAVSRRVGTAVVRNTIKRRLREAFRLLQHEFPSRQAQGGAYDVVISVRPHEPLALSEYRCILSESVQQLHTSWQKKRQQRSANSPDASAKPKSASRSRRRRKPRA
jgi:ribonuclease P protein component